MDKRKIVIALTVAFGVSWGVVTAHEEEVKPNCTYCRAEIIENEEIQRYIQLGLDAITVGDMQIRSVDLGATNAQVAIVHRGSLQEASGRVAEHSLVSEIYYMLSGGGTVLTSPFLIDPVPRAADSYAVTNLNGPGHNAPDVRDGIEYELAPGDVFIIPAGTGHAWIEIPDHVTYLMVRIDPEQVVALMDKDDSDRFLEQGQIRTGQQR